MLNAVLCVWPARCVSHPVTLRQAFPKWTQRGGDEMRRRLTRLSRILAGFKDGKTSRNRSTRLSKEDHRLLAHEGCNTIRTSPLFLYPYPGVCVCVCWGVDICVRRVGVREALFYLWGM